MLCFSVVLDIVKLFIGYKIFVRIKFLGGTNKHENFFFKFHKRDSAVVQLVWKHAVNAPGGCVSAVLPQKVM
jgi:hypothetical protein